MSGTKRKTSEEANDNNMSLIDKLHQEEIDRLNDILLEKEM